MEKLPDKLPVLRVVWNRNKTIPSTHAYEITIRIKTSIDIKSIEDWLLESLGGTLENLANQTGAKEELIKIESKLIDSGLNES